MPVFLKFYIILMQLIIDLFSKFFYSNKIYFITQYIVIKLFFFYCTSDVNFLTDDQSFSMIENTSSQKTPDLPCSISGLTSISFSIAGYASSTPPSYVTIDTSTGKLSITAPDITADTEFNFYINSILSGVTDPIQKRIKLTINNWSVSNWKVCLSSSSTIWDIWNSGSTLTSGAWVTTSDTAKAFTSTSTSLVLATSGWLVFVNFMNTSSIASLWLVINQLQLFMLLTISRTYIPQDIKGFITGSKFALNIFEYIPFKRLNIYPSFLNMFEFGTVNSSFDSFGINYQSTIINSYSFFICLIFIMILHIIVLLLRFIFSKWGENRFIKLMKFLTQKGYNFLTFGYYIRSVLEISQLILISSIYEAYSFILKLYLSYIIQQILRANTTYNQNFHNFIL